VGVGGGQVVDRWGEERQEHEVGVEGGVEAEVEVKMVAMDEFHTIPHRRRGYP